MSPDEPLPTGWGALLVCYLIASLAAGLTIALTWYVPGYLWRGWPTTVGEMLTQVAFGGLLFSGVSAALALLPCLLALAIFRHFNVRHWLADVIAGGFVAASTVVVGMGEWEVLPAGAVAGIVFWVASRKLS